MWRKSRLKLIENSKLDLIWLFLHRVIRVRYLVQCAAVCYMAQSAVLVSWPKTPFEVFVNSSPYVSHWAQSAVVFVNRYLAQCAAVVIWRNSP